MKRELAAGRHVRPGRGANNVGITPSAWRAHVGHDRGRQDLRRLLRRLVVAVEAMAAGGELGGAGR